jgi:hypothetical protein
MTDRHAEGYEPRFDVDYEYGHQGELFVGFVIEALKRDRVEVKRDARYSQTGNFYVEYECRRNGHWCKSGIATSEAELWAFVLGDSGMCVVIPTQSLKELCRQRFRQRHVAAELDGSHPTKGVLVSASSLLAWAKERRQAEVA